MTTSYRLRSGRGSHIRAVRKSCHMAKLGGGLRPPAETSPQDALRAAGRPRAGPRASEASNPEIAPAKPALEADCPPVAAFLVAMWRLLREAPPPVKRAPGPGAGVGAVARHRPAVDVHGADPVGKAPRVVIGRGVTDPRRVEDDEVGEGPGQDH